MRRRPRHAHAGYIPLVGVAVGAGAGGWLASVVGAIEFPIALAGAVVGYLISGMILRRIFSDDE